MASNYFSISLVIKDIQIKTTLRYHLTQSGIKKTQSEVVPTVLGLVGPYCFQLVSGFLSLGLDSWIQAIHTQETVDEVTIQASDWLALWPGR